MKLTCKGFIEVTVMHDSSDASVKHDSNDKTLVAIDCIIRVVNKTSCGVIYLTDSTVLTCYEKYGEIFHAIINASQN